MNSTLKIFGLLLVAAQLFASCGLEIKNPQVEFATAAFCELPQPPDAGHAAKNRAAVAAASQNRGSVAGFLADCQNQLGRLQSGFSAGFGTPHRTVFPH